MDDNLKIIPIKEIFGECSADYIKETIKYDYCGFIAELETYDKIHGTNCADYYKKLANKIANIMISEYSQHNYGMSIDMAIATKPEESIKKTFCKAAEEMGFDIGFQGIIDSELERIAAKLNKRFTFDEISLIHLIEASKGSNIQLEEDTNRYNNGKRQVLEKKDSYGKYKLVDRKKDIGDNVYTLGKPIPTIDVVRDAKFGNPTTDEEIMEESKRLINIAKNGLNLFKNELTTTEIQEIEKYINDFETSLDNDPISDISLNLEQFKKDAKKVLRVIEKHTTVSDDKAIYLPSYPGGRDILNGGDKNELMKKVMRNLFDNLNLCKETYEFFYKSRGDYSFKNVSVPNVAHLADGKKFDFEYNINNKNLPHLLGIPRADAIPDETKKYFATTTNGTITYPINNSSTALDILQVLLNNQERIISDGGLIDDKNGKVYQILPWEKIILKTSSFMRGDFFRTCFCLAKLGKRGINSPKEEYTTITPTYYDKEMIYSEYDARRILNDLLVSSRIKGDYIFRTFVNSGNRYVTDSIITAKGETIRVKSNDKTNEEEKIKTLDRYRHAIENSKDSDSDGGIPRSSVVTAIENDNPSRGTPGVGGSGTGGGNRRDFSNLEQAITHIIVSEGLKIPVTISKELAAYESKILDEISFEPELLDDDEFKVKLSSKLDDVLVHDIKINYDFEANDNYNYTKIKKDYDDEYIDLNELRGNSDDDTYTRKR